MTPQLFSCAVVCFSKGVDVEFLDSRLRYLGHFYIFNMYIKNYQYT